MYMYSFLLPATLIFVNGIIRQGVGISFIFLALAFLHERKWLFMAIAVIIAINMHTTTIVLFATMIGLYFVLKKPIHYLISIPLLLFFTFIFDVGKITFLSDFLSNNLTFDIGFQHYLDNSDRWFGEDAMLDIYSQTTRTKIVMSLFNITIFYLGYNALKIRENKQVMYVYNTVVLGIILFNAVYLFELLRRFVQPMEMLFFIPLGYILYVYFKDCKQPQNQETKFFKKCFFVGLLFIAWRLQNWRHFLLYNPNADFFWNH